MRTRSLGTRARTVPEELPGCPDNGAAPPETGAPPLTVGKGAAGGACTRAALPRDFICPVPQEIGQLFMSQLVLDKITSDKL